MARLYSLQDSIVDRCLQLLPFSLRDHQRPYLIDHPFERIETLIKLCLEIFAFEHGTRATMGRKSLETILGLQGEGAKMEAKTQGANLRQKKSVSITPCWSDSMFALIASNIPRNSCPGGGMYKFAKSCATFPEGRSTFIHEVGARYWFLLRIEELDRKRGVGRAECATSRKLYKMRENGAYGRWMVKRTA